MFGRNPSPRPRQESSRPASRRVVRAALFAAGEYLYLFESIVPGEHKPPCYCARFLIITIAVRTSYLFKDISAVIKIKLICLTEVSLL